MFSHFRKKRMKFESYEKTFLNLLIKFPADSAICKNTIKADSNATKRGLLILPTVLCPSIVTSNSGLRKVIINSINELLRRRLHIILVKVCPAWPILDLSEIENLSFISWCSHTTINLTSLNQKLLRLILPYKMQSNYVLQILASYALTVTV